MPAETPQPGKISSEIFRRVIRPQLGRPHPAVKLGPQHGVDAGVVDLGQGQVLITTTDPLFVVPAYGWERAAWFALHIVASDAVTTGLSPNFASVDLNLPMAMADRDFELFWNAFHQACDALGVAVVTGHTGRYEGCAYPILGGLTLFGLGAERDLVTPAMARAGDRVMVTKGPAIETVGQLAVMFPERLAAACGPVVAKEAAGLFWQMSVVADARAAVAVGVGEQGVTMLHDATEFGLWGALVEVAEAAGLGIVIDQAKIPYPAVVREVCTHFGLDPFSSSSEGTLVATCRPQIADAMVQRLGEAGILAALVGELVPRGEGLQRHAGGRTLPLVYPAIDPFWPAFSQALRASGQSISGV